MKRQNTFLSKFIKLATVSEAPLFMPGQDSSSWPGMNRESLSLRNCRQFNKVYLRTGFVSSTKEDWLSATVPMPSSLYLKRVSPPPKIVSIHYKEWRIIPLYCRIYFKYRLRYDFLTYQECNLRASIL